MTRKVATQVLSAHLGQLISLSEARVAGKKRCYLAFLVSNGTWSYDESPITEGDSWEEVVFYVIHDARGHYDERYDFFEQDYLDRLIQDRKARIISKRNNQSNTFQGSVP